VVDWCYIFSISKLGVYPLSVTVYNVVYYLTIPLSYYRDSGARSIEDLGRLLKVLQ
jgi:hypothetical protein